MKVPSYFTTLKILLVIILSAVIFFIIRQYNLDVKNNGVIISETFYDWSLAGTVILLLLLITVFIIVNLLSNRYYKIKAGRGLKLSKETAKFEDSIESITDPFFALDADYNIMYCNRAFRNLTGKADAPLAGTSLYEAFRQFNTPSIHQNFEEVFETGKLLHFELYDYFYDNWKDVNIHPIAGGVSVHMKDASLRKRYEAELKTAMQFLEETNTVGLIGGWELDVATGKVTWTNETCNIHEAPLGYAPDLKNAISFYKPGYSRDTITHAVKDGIEKGTHWDKMLQIITLTGKEKWVRAIGRPEMENAEVVRLLGSFQDVQQQKLMLDKLTETEQKFNAVFEHSTKAKLLLNMEEQIIDANQSFLDRVGYSKAEIINKPLSSITLEKEQDYATVYDLKWKEKKTLLHKNGNAVEILISGADIKDKNGVTIYFLLNVDF